MIREPRDEWQAELEATGGYDERQRLNRLWFETKEQSAYDDFIHWMKSVTWPAELTIWKKASEWYASTLSGLSDRSRSSLPQIAIRCRERGCLLGRVYKFSLHGGGERIYFVGSTSSGKSKHGICNWAFADSFDGLQRWWQVGCKHGHIKLGSYELAELHYPASDLESKLVPDEYQLAWRAGVYLPPISRWSK